MANWQVTHKGPIYTVTAYGMTGKGYGWTIRDYAYQSTAEAAARGLANLFPYADITVTEYDEEARTVIYRNG